MPTALLLGLLLLGFAWFVGRIDSAVRAAGHHDVDTRRVRIAGRDWVPRDWEERIAARLTALGPIEAREREALERAAAEIAAMPFVAHVGDVSTVWPDGLCVDVVLRRPRACVRVGELYLCVAEDGVVLPGAWPLPPDTGSGRLPVLGPFDWPTDELLPGDRLDSAEVEDGLAIATSLFEHLGPDVQDRLGIVLIDAREARAASVDNPGAQLFLEGRRVVLFGRAPNADAPGELPVAQKWRHLEAALELLDGPAGEDWDLLDARWDQAVLRPRISPEQADAWETR
ncbi:MAG: hypothetical protein H6831_13560 [Planctomycetes bacterium]|nr:hypothetical protein [Planctomycetota bacterium]